MNLVNSMTGYGRGEAQEAEFRFVVEIKALNHRHRDIIIRLPRELAGLEEISRRQIQDSLSRGRIEVYVNLETTAEREKKVSVDLALARAYHGALQELRAAFNLGDSSLTAHELALFPEVIVLQKDDLDPEALAPLLEKALADAISALLSQRIREGASLAGNIFLKLNRLRELAQNIKERSPGLLEDYRQRLTRRLEDLHEDREFDRQRLFTEVALFAERCSIDEELVRLQSHLEAFAHDLQDGGVVGRKLDFLLQEMNREVNTISVKSSDLEISHLVVEAKSEIEKIREQIQNIE